MAAAWRVRNIYVNQAFDRGDPCLKLRQKLIQKNIWTWEWYRKVFVIDDEFNVDKQGVVIIFPPAARYQGYLYYNIWSEKHQEKKKVYHTDSVEINLVDNVISITWRLV